MNTVEEILSEALNLSIDDRLELVQRLVETIRGEAQVFRSFHC